MAVITSIGKWLWDVFARGTMEEVVGGTAREHLREWATGRVDSKFYQGKVDVRADALADMERIEAGDPTTGKAPIPLPNLWGWYQEAKVGTFPYSENKFVALLSRVPKPERDLVYPYWNTLSREDFFNRLSFIDHDVVQQTARTVYEVSKSYAVTVWGKGKVKREQARGIIEGQATRSSSRREALIQYRNVHRSSPTIGESMRRMLLWLLMAGGIILLGALIAQL